MTSVSKDMLVDVDPGPSANALNSKPITPSLRSPSKLPQPQDRLQDHPHIQHPAHLSGSRPVSPRPTNDSSVTTASRQGTSTALVTAPTAVSALVAGSLSSMMDSGREMQMDDGPSSPERPLNVTDALSYLDSVKIQFQDRPDVYNRFLDIMKDFKSQYIDTPGVIERVSNLFHGHPALIQGFNTFLPAGYRIECTSDALNPNYITVTTPAGTVTQSTNAPFSLDPAITHGNSLLLSNHLNPNTMPMSGHPFLTQQHMAPLPISAEEDMEPALVYLQKVKARYSKDPERYRRFLELLSPSEAPGALNDQEVLLLVGQIFQDDPDLMDGFHQFLPDRNVQRQAALKLDNVQGSSSRGRDGELKKKRGDPASSTPQQQGAGGAVPQKRKRRALERDGSLKEKEIVSGKGGPGSSKRTKQGAGSDVTSPSLAQRHAVVQPPLSPRRTTFAHHTQTGPGSSSIIVSHHPHLNQHLAPPIHSPMMGHSPVPFSHSQPPLESNILPPDSNFFDRVKRSLDSRDTYNEFLKVINLFTQGIIDSGRLVHESRNYLGDGELMVELIGILGWDERRERVFSGGMNGVMSGVGIGGGIVGGDDVWTRPTGVLDRPSRNQLHERYGSYRKLPASETNVVCSGRDEMCKSVLNDYWISQPTFASEDAGFIAHKKNVYEEALHRSEEERHEYDFHLEAIHRTILFLEPFNNKIAQLSPEERLTYKMNPKLSGNGSGTGAGSSAGKAIQLRILKKVYGKEPGVQVFKAIQEMPSVAIPVVLTRLKQKEEEWKRAQAEWNKVWREVDARNYYKSLDHQGINFRSYDKKQTTSKFLLNQIEVARDEQRFKRSSLIDPLFARTRARHQMEFVVEDVEVVRDAVKVVCSYLDRTGEKVGVGERKKVEGFLRNWVPVFLMMDLAQFNAGFVPRQDSGSVSSADGNGNGAGGNGSGSGSGEAEGQSEVEGPLEDVESSGTPPPPSTSHSKTGRGGKRNNSGNNPSGSSGTNGGGGSDLRKRLLKSEQAKSSRRTRATQENSAASSRGSPAVGDAMRVVTNGLGMGRGNGSAPSSPTEGRTTRKGTFYTNTAFYVLIRQFELLYSRLHLFKSIAASAASSPSSYKPNPVAHNLGLLNDLGRLGDRAYDAVHYYDLFLESCEKLFDNVLEQHVFEDMVRYMFGIKDGYKAFTIDKLIGSIIKQVQTVLADPRSMELWDLLQRERDITSPTTQDLINARKNAEKILGPDENLFRMDWLPESKMITIQLLGKDDSNFDDTEVMNGRWQAYIDSYVSPGETEGVPPSLIARKPFLQRTMRGIVVDAPPPISSSGTLSMRVCVRTYRLFYVSRGEESFWRTRTRGDGVEEMRKGVLKGKQRKARWLEKWLNESDEDVEEKQPKEKEGEKEKQKEVDKEDKEEEREEVVEDMEKAEIAGVGEEKETEEGKTDKDKTKEKEEEKGKDKEGKKTDKEVREIDTMIVEDGEIPEKEEGEIVSPSESLKNPIGIESAQDTEGLKEQDKGKAKVEDKLEPAAAVEKRSKSVSVEAMRTPDKEKEKATSQSGEDVSMETVPTASS